ncbi:MAG: polysaccharide biosynthesis/export family protein [Nitrospirales bacterium]|nr:polysaccharide biosynthesis/export family protein [Nitrospira sp.]MDR4502683.1 polysaccharide biosynthesis/export family protein [Nitrospirales bacterium]
MVALILFIALLSAACNPSVVVKDPTAVGAPGTTIGKVGPTLMQEYVIQPGDELDIKFFYNPDLNELVIVRPDGRISLQLVGETIAAGRTPRALTQLLTQEYDKELKKPVITVIVRSFGARVYVDGEVEKPGELELSGPLTVMQAIARAEGATEKAWQEAIVIRRIYGKQPLVIPVDIEAVLTGEDFTQDIGLVPFDIVYVPRSPIADVNLWVDQYVRRNIPIHFGLFFPLR